MHNPHTMTKIQRLQQLINIKPNIIIIQRRKQRLMLRILHMLKNQSRCPRLGIPHHIQQLYYIHASLQIFQYFDFSFDFFRFDWFENFDDAAYVLTNVVAFEDFRVFAAAEFFDELEVVLGAVFDLVGFVVPEGFWAVLEDVGVDAGYGGGG